MKCKLITEDGGILETVLDRRDVLVGLAEKLTTEESCCLRYLDPYGDTIFNRPQMAPLLLELDTLQRRSPTPEEMALLEGIERLARRCNEEVHLYLKFVGD